MKIVYKVDKNIKVCYNIGIRCKNAAFVVSASLWCNGCIQVSKTLWSGFES